MTAEQRESIVALARNMYIKDGIKMVRMDDIAHGAGVSKRTLYETFGDKEELIYLSMTYHFELLAAQHDAAAKGAPNILVAIMRVMESALQSSEVSWKLISSLRRFYPAVAKRIESEKQDEKRQEFLDGLEAGVRDGLLNPRANLDLAITMLNFLSTSLVTGSEDLSLPAGVTPQMAFMEFMVNVLRGISTTKGIEIIDKYVENIKK